LTPGDFAPLAKIPFDKNPAQMAGFFICHTASLPTRCAFLIAD
jgi:hypothetical protein